MQFDEVDAGDFRIYAGAIEGPHRFGYIAAVVVMRQTGPKGSGLREETYRDERLAGGFTWATPKEALRFAINAGRDVVMCRAGMSA
ncbi:MAG TPA: hypothetical protein VGM81_06035 [Burkholderiaceae bacterium]|jgi:hypothetical protein